jgi:putative ABC transport system substrate-binding protein
LWPLAARAQPPTMPTIGFLSSRGSNDLPGYTGFFAGLRQSGYQEGSNVAIEYCWAENQYDRLQKLAGQLVDRSVTAVVAMGGPAALAAKASTASIPIVFLVGIDPVASGLVTSMNRPNGNATGVSGVTREMNDKRLELLHELLPRAATIGVLLNPRNPSEENTTRDVMAAARALRQRIVIFSVGADRDLDMTSANLAEQRVDGLVVTDDPFLISHPDQLVALAARHRIPTIYPLREFVKAGGLISYGPNITEAYRQVGIYVGRILSGAKISDLPVQEPTKFELVLNLKTAAALGIEVPTSILLRADEVIE